MATNHQLDKDLLCDGDYLGAYRRFLEHFVTNVCARDDQLPVKMGRRDVRQCELIGEITDIVLQHLNQRFVYDTTCADSYTVLLLLTNKSWHANFPSTNYLNYTFPLYPFRG